MPGGIVAPAERRDHSGFKSNFGVERGKHGGLLDLRLRFGWLEHLFVTPAYHHWHHTRHDHVDHNYATVLPWVDRIFGTHHLPKGEWPAALSSDATEMGRSPLPAITATRSVGLSSTVGRVLGGFISLFVCLVGQRDEEVTLLAGLQEVDDLHRGRKAGELDGGEHEPRGADHQPRQRSGGRASRLPGTCRTGCRRS